MASTRNTWLVTGASSGLGAEICLAALRDGDKVVGTARNVERAKRDNPSFGELGGQWIELDVAWATCEEVVAKSVAEFDVHVLVNNAGYVEG
jgi:NAD(P)-dependent dehydrogenase (short-subunit alcohol dehydrogenase family)